MRRGAKLSNNYSDKCLRAVKRVAAMSRPGGTVVVARPHGGEKWRRIACSTTERSNPMQFHAIFLGQRERVMTTLWAGRDNLARGPRQACEQAATLLSPALPGSARTASLSELRPLQETHTALASLTLHPFSLYSNYFVGKYKVPLFFFCVVANNSLH